jgi:hypothetical protein
MEQYCIGLIIDGNDDFNRIVKKIDDINLLIIPGSDPGDVTTYPDGSTSVERYVLPGTNITVESLVLVNANVPDALKQKIQGDGGNALHASKITWFGNGAVTYENMVKRLQAHATEDGCEKLWIIDAQTDLTGDLLSKFGPV